MVNKLKYQQLWIENAEREYGNRYAAINVAVKQAKDILRLTDHRILDSEALSWIVFGQDHIELSKVRTKSTLDVLLDKYLGSVNDADICNAVTLSLIQSYANKQLEYDYGSVETWKHARIRVLCNIIWNELFDTNNLTY